MNPPTWGDLIPGHVARPKRPTPRHRADRRHHRLDPQTDVKLTVAAIRASLRAALYGSDTPAGGLTLLTRLQRPGRTS